jgi:hypothetical protein
VCVIDIPDEHEFMDSELVELLKTGEVDFWVLKASSSPVRVVRMQRWKMKVKAAIDQPI